MHSSDVRASDLDRERAVEFLKAHYADGRLQHDELAWRSDAAYRAVRIAELDWLTSDLPAVVRRPRRRRLSPAGVVLIAASLVALVMLVPPEGWMLALAVLIGFAIFAIVACVVVAPIAIPVLLLAWLAHIVARATRPQPQPQPRSVGWR